MYEIEKGVPLLPKSGNRPTGELHRTLLQMELGDSVLLKTKQDEYIIRAVNARGGAKFSVRKQPDGVYRAWRIK